VRNAHFSRVHQYPAQPAFRWVLSCRAKRLFHITHRNTRFERFEYSMAGFAKKLATMMCTFGGPASREVGGCRSLQMSGVYRREPRRHFCDLVNRKRPLVNGGGIGPQAEAGSRPLKCTVRQGPAWGRISWSSTGEAGTATPGLRPALGWRNYRVWNGERFYNL